MHIGMVTDTFFPRVNGVGNSTLTFAREFRARGHQVTIFAPEFPNHQETDPQIWRFPSRRIPYNAEDRLAKPFCQGSRSLFKRLPELALDVMHTQTPFSLGYSMMFRARQIKLPLVHTYHTLFEAYVPHYVPFLPASVGRALVRMLSRHFCNRHDRIVVPSTAMGEILQRYGIRTPMAVIPTGINLAPFANLDGERMRHKLGFGRDEILLLTMGRVAREKNLPFLFEVLKRLLPKQPKARLVIAGRGPALEETQAEAKQQGLQDKVIFVGLLDRRDWADLYAAADLHLLASVTETQGLVLTEAMAAGTPCVAVAAMGVKDVMADGGGILVPLDAAAFTAAVDQLLSDPALYQAKKAEAALQAQAWSAGSQAEKMLALYQTIIQERSSHWT